MDMMKQNNVTVLQQIQKEMEGAQCADVLTDPNGSYLLSFSLSFSLPPSLSPCFYLCPSLSLIKQVIIPSKSVLSDPNIRIGGIELGLYRTVA